MVGFGWFSQTKKRLDEYLIAVIDRTHRALSVEPVSPSLEPVIGPIEPENT